LKRLDTVWIQAVLKSSASAVRPTADVLKAPDHDPRSNPNFCSEASHIVLRVEVEQSGFVLSRNQGLGGEPVRFLFDAAVPVGLVDECFLLRMEEEVGHFVEEREPKYVVPAMSETQLNQRLVRCEPSGGPVDTGPLDLAGNDHSDTYVCAAVDEEG
jgi:hypothetical protein